MKWIADEAGDLINLEHIEAINLCNITAEQEAPEGHTHELLAVTTDQESYRLFSGVEATCKQTRKEIAQKLEAINH